MPRKPRIMSSTSIYHIILRSVNQHIIFEKERTNGKAGCQTDGYFRNYNKTAVQNGPLTPSPRSIPGYIIAGSTVSSINRTLSKMRGLNVPVMPTDMFSSLLT